MKDQLPKDDVYPLPSQIKVDLWLEGLSYILIQPSFEPCSTWRKKNHKTTKTRRIFLQSLINTSLYLYFQKMAHLTFCEALACFAISIKMPLRIPVRSLPCFHIVQRYHSFYSHPSYSCLCHIQKFQIAYEGQIYNWLTKHYFPWQARTENRVGEITSCIQTPPLGCPAHTCK